MNDTKLLPLSGKHGKGKHSLVDADTYAWAKHFRWHVSNGYATARGLSLARIVNDTPPDLWVDHINGNPLDNRRCNLRAVTPQQNQYNQRANRRAARRRTSRFRGVSWWTQKGKWRAVVNLSSGKQRHVGTFNNEEAAARAFDAAAVEEFGEYARLNFPVNGASAALPPSEVA